MQRNITESFEQYKARRAAVSAAEKQARRKLQGGSKTSRETQRDTLRQAGKLKGTYGATLVAHFARVRIAS